MSATLLAALLLTQAPDAGFRPDPARFKALSDGQGHYVVYDAETPYGEDLFAGDGKTFYRVPVRGGGRSGDETWSVSFWEPRLDRTVRGANSDLSMKDSGATYTLDCGRKQTPFSPVAAAELATILEKGTFLPRRFTRLPHRLLRDDEGTYYFVDRLRADEHRDFRVFVGNRGKLKQLPLKDVVDDSKGTIFATKNGSLRLVANTESYTWVKGKAETKLIDVPVEDNVRMIYMDLGPYAGLPLGTPCDDLM